MQMKLIYDLSNKKKRNQSKCILWRKMRQSIITALVVGRICKTIENKTMPLKIVQNIIGGSNFSNAATRYGLLKDHVH